MKLWKRLELRNSWCDSYGSCTKHVLECNQLVYCTVSLCFIDCNFKAIEKICKSEPDMPQAVNSELLLYADNTCLIYMGKNIQKIEEQLNSDFTSLCEWFIDNKLSVHFSEEKTKSILFGTKRQLKDQRDLNLKYGDIEIKQHSRVTYLGCILDNILSGQHMAAKVLNTVNNRLKFLYCKQKFLSLSL